MGARSIGAAGGILRAWTLEAGWTIVGVNPRLADSERPRMAMSKVATKTMAANIADRTRQPDGAIFFAALYVSDGANPRSEVFGTAILLGRGSAILAASGAGETGARGTGVVRQARRLWQLWKRALRRPASEGGRRGNCVAEAAAVETGGFGTAAGTFGLGPAPQLQRRHYRAESSRAREPRGLRESGVPYPGGSPPPARFRRSPLKPAVIGQKKSSCNRCC